MAQLSLRHSLAGDGEKEERKRWGSNEKKRLLVEHGLSLRLQPKENLKIS
jgi:hypothetical protein